MSLYTQPSTSKIAELVAARFAADAGLVSFFGADRIAVLSRAEIQCPIRKALLGVIPQSVKPVRVGEDLEINLPVLVRAYFPVETPIARRTAPTGLAVNQGPASGISGTFWYRFSEVDQDGESAASAPVSITVTSHTPRLSFPATTRDGFRVWRATAEDGQYHFAAVLPAGTTTWDDTVAAAELRDELAPILDYQEMVIWRAIQVLYTDDAEMLEEGGQAYADAALEVDLRGPVLITRRNLMAYDFNATFPIVVHAATGENVTSSAP
jgi:hypothetical protein